MRVDDDDDYYYYYYCEKIPIRLVPSKLSIPISASALRRRSLLIEIGDVC